MIGDVVGSGITYAAPDSLGVTNILYESDCRQTDTMSVCPSYRLCFVTDGEGVMHTGGEEYKVCRGDVIVIPPATYCTLEGIRLFESVCINYNGTDAQRLAEQVGLGRAARIYSGFEGLAPLWGSMLNLCASVAFTRAKGVVFFTFSEVLKRMSEECSLREGMSAPQRIKNYIDDNFTNCEITLNYLAEKLSYHPNYISSVFNDEYGLSIIKYINILRIRHACFLMEQGVCALKTLAPLCGFNNVDYFSSVFKAQMGVTPKAHIKHISSSGTAL